MKIFIVEIEDAEFEQFKNYHIEQGHIQPDLPDVAVLAIALNVEELIPSKVVEVVSSVPSSMKKATHFDA